MKWEQSIELAPGFARVDGISVELYPCLFNKKYPRCDDGNVPLFAKEHVQQILVTCGFEWSELPDGNIFYFRDDHYGTTRAHVVDNLIYYSMGSVVMQVVTKIFRVL